MVAPADPKHQAAREQTVLALELVLEEFLTGIAGAVIEAKRGLRDWAGMPPAIDPDVPASLQRRRKPAVDTRLTDDSDQEQGEYSPEESARPPRTRGERAVPAAEADVDQVEPPEAIAADTRKLNAWRKGYAIGAAGGKPDSPYGEDPKGAAAWIDKAWQEGWKAGHDALARKA